MAASEQGLPPPDGDHDDAKPGRPAGVAEAGGAHAADGFGAPPVAGTTAVVSSSHVPGPGAGSAGVGTSHQAVDYYQHERPADAPRSPAAAGAGPTEDKQFVVVSDPVLPPGWSSDYATPAAHGWVAKFEGQGGFTKRYMVQRGSILLYYETYGAPEPRGVFLLDTASVQKGAMLATRGGVLSLVNRSRLATRFCLVLSKPSGLKWELCFPNERTMDLWIGAMTATGVVTKLPDLPLQPEAPQSPAAGSPAASTGYGSPAAGGPMPKDRASGGAAASGGADAGAAAAASGGGGGGAAPPAPQAYASLSDAYAATPAAGGAYGTGQGGYPAMGAAAGPAATPAPGAGAAAAAATPGTANTISATPSHETRSEFRTIAPAAGAGDDA